MFGWLTQVLIFIWNPHREWFYEREKYNGGNVFLGDESIPKIIGHARVKLLLKDRRTKTLPFVLHILDMVRNLISSNKMSDVVVYTIFEKDRWKMVQGAMLLPILYLFYPARLSDTTYNTSSITSPSLSHSLLSQNNT